MADPRVKQIKIKTGVVKRTKKDVESYQKEVTKEEERHEKMKGAGKDEYELKQQTKVIEESKMMVPETMKKLDTYSKQLKDYLEKEQDLAECEEYKEAKTVLEEADKLMKECKESNPE